MKADLNQKQSLLDVIEWINAVSSDKDSKHIQAMLNGLSSLADRLESELRTKFKFARRCDATNRGMNEGFCFGDGEMYFSTREHLLEHLRTIEWVDCNGNLSTDCNGDEELLDFFFDEEMYYHTAWEELDEDEWYESDYEDGRDAVLVSAE